MNRLHNPTADQVAGLRDRAVADQRSAQAVVDRIVADVRSKGDRALVALTQEFDGVTLDGIVHSVDPDVLEHTDPDLIIAIRSAIGQVQRFHEAFDQCGQPIETAPGVTCWYRRLPIQRVGIYVPGGTAPLLSTLIMLAVPARIAGCQEIVVCTPPDNEGQIPRVIESTLALLGMSEIVLCGGAQAIAALAFGTESVPKVDKIFGPGNTYVTLAKETVARLGTAIDLPAGPSELLVIADEYQRPDWIAADLLSQAEHGADSQVVFVSWSADLLEKVADELETQVRTLPREHAARQALERSALVLVHSLDEAIAVSDAYAPEHLILALNDPVPAANQIQNAGSVFLGPTTPESIGDYASGTNHVLPTAGWARSTAGVSAESFMKRVTFQSATPSGLEGLRETVTTLARAEGLEGHARAVEVRRNG